MNEPKNAEVVQLEPQNTPEVVQATTVIQTDEGKNYLSREVWGLIKEVAETIQISEALPPALKNSKANIVLTLLTGKEMGMSPMRSIQGLYIVNGKINVYGSETVRRLREHGYSVEYSNETDEACTARVYKKGVNGETIEEYTEVFKYADALTSGWTGKTYKGKGADGKAEWDGTLKAGWLKGQNRKLKMRYGALSAIIKSYIPEVLGAAGDIQEVAEDYPEIVQATTVNGEVKPPLSTKEQRNNSLQSFLKKKDEEKTPKAEAVEGEVIELEVKTDISNLPAKERYFTFAEITLNWANRRASEEIRKYYAAKTLHGITDQQYIDFIDAMTAQLNADVMNP